MKNRIKKAKDTIVEYRYEICATTLVTALVALAVYADAKEAEENEKQAKIRNKYIIEQNRQGKTVVQLADGTFLGVAL